jgi:hypothetical protein
LGSCGIEVAVEVEVELRLKFAVEWGMFETL